MKRTAILFLSMASVALTAQNEPTHKLDPARTVGEPVQKKTPAPTPESQAVFWSQDFANGIPSSWSQNGTPSTAQWEYRGPSTSPDNTEGSRGAFSGVNDNPPTNDPIASSSAGNGFVIFDSDYLDNGGNSANMGAGTAPAPHTGRLTTGLIDLSSNPQVELKLESFARRFQAGFLVAFSTDGGNTYIDTTELYPEDAFGVNISTPNPVTSVVNISNAVGGQDSVVMQFIFDGTRSNANGSGYYFWMIDDIELRDPPRNQMYFTTFNGAPAQDMIYDSNPAQGKYGIMHVDQITPVEFDANLFNYGTQNQSNVNLEVEIWDASGPTMVTTVSANGCASLPAGDTCDFNDLTTSSWTPPAQPANYILVYKGVSDSISSAATTTTDTFNFYVRDDLYSTDRNEISNFVGTNSANPPVQQFGVRFSLENKDPDTLTNLNFLEGIEVNFSTQTDSTASIEFAIWDTTGFTLAGNQGFPAGTQAIKRFFFTLDGSAPGNQNYFFQFGTEDSIYSNATQSWTDTTNPYALPTGTYFITMTMLPNATDGVVRLANDASFAQPSESTIMQLNDGNWYSGFTSSTYEAPFMRLRVGAEPVYDIGVAETDLNSFSVYPNPTTGLGKIRFEQAGSYDIQVMDMIGNQVHSINRSVNANERVEFDMSDLPAGVYLVNIQGESIDKTVKLTIE
ncbi:MAG: T9SS type A sorting domain-containing protein [Schleiferiaceae bacterium]|nr:T9SS type A sorting domain-containing protein [Schleiferiaceae bacterium]